MKPLIIRQTLLNACTLAVGLNAYVSVQAAESGEIRPNILFILSDDHTAQTWGIYGDVLAEYAHTPNIRQLAKEGTVLDNCFCANSISSPSRATILTGLYSHKNGLYTLDDSLNTSIPTLATVLSQNGYRTGLVGKWHLKSQPQGVDYYSIFYDQGEYRDPTFINSTDPWPGNRNFGERVRGFSTDLVTDRAIRWIKEQAMENEPFLMCCHFKAAHEPYDYPIRMEHLYDGVEFPEPDNLLDWGKETNGRSFQGIQTLHPRWHTWPVWRWRARKGEISCHVSREILRPTGARESNTAIGQTMISVRLTWASGQTGTS